MINANPYANGAALFTRSGHAARRFQQDVEVGMAGINVPIPVPMAFYSFGGWRNSLFGDLNVHGVGRRAFLHAAEDRDVALARRRQRRAGLPHAADGVTVARSGGRFVGAAVIQPSFIEDPPRQPAVRLVFAERSPARTRLCPPARRRER